MTEPASDELLAELAGIVAQKPAEIRFEGWETLAALIARIRQAEAERDKARGTIEKIQSEFYQFCVRHKEVAAERDEARAEATQALDTASAAIEDYNTAIRERDEALARIRQQDETIKQMAEVIDHADALIGDYFVDWKSSARAARKEPT